jgi:hypothetical protein
MKKKITTEEVEEKVNNGEEIIDKYFDAKNASFGRPKKLKLRQKIIKTNLDITENLANELDEMAENLNISRQAVIKMMIRKSLDEHYLSLKNKMQIDQKNT